MFTGLIQLKGIIDQIKRSSEGSGIFVDHPAWETSLIEGESVALDGICLTVKPISKNKFYADLLAETIERSNLRTSVRGKIVNLERALKYGDRIGGHFVTGHIDGTGIVRQIVRKGKDIILRVECSSDLSRQMVKKGSVALNGVSLTLVSVDSKGFEVHLIPTTVSKTNLERPKVGSILNIETDLHAKYIANYLNQSRSDISFDTLRKAGIV